MGKGKIAAVILLAAMMASVPASAYGFEMEDEYYEISCQETDAFMSDDTMVKAGITGQLVLSKLESSWASESSIRIADTGVITARVVAGDNGLNVIGYTAKAPGKAQLIVVVESGAAVNMGTFYVTTAQDGGMAAAEWVQENGQWKYKTDDGTYKDNGWLADQGKWYYLGRDGVMRAGRWVREGK